MHKTVKILVGVLFIAIAALFSLSAQGVQEKKASVAYFSGRVETVEWEDAKIAAFEAANPGIHIEHEFQKDASNVIKVKLASGEMPDLTTVVTQDFIDQGLYADLSDSEFWERIVPSVKALCTDLKTGKQFRIATNVTMGGLFYNKQLFAELGLSDAQTWDHFIANLETVKKARPDIDPIFPGRKRFLDPWPFDGNSGLTV